MLFDEYTSEALADDLAVMDEVAASDAQAEDDEDDIGGIAFTVPEGFSSRECFILRQALYKLSDADNPNDTRLAHIFRRNEHRIHQIARRLMSTTAANATVIIGPAALRKS